VLLCGQGVHSDRLARACRCLLNTISAARVMARCSRPSPNQASALTDMADRGAWRRCPPVKWSRRVGTRARRCRRDGRKSECLGWLALAAISASSASAISGTPFVQSLPRREDAHPVAVAATDEAIAVVLDLVGLLRPARHAVAIGRQARLDKAGRMPSGAGSVPAHAP
jgi:hypothetical protein